MEGSSSRSEGSVTCGTWIRRPENAHLAVVGKARHGDQPSMLEIFSFDPKTSSLFPFPSAMYVIEEGEPVSIAVHPSGDDFVCSTTVGACKWIELRGHGDNIELLAKDLVPLQGTGLQKCLAFSFDGSRFASGGVDGNLRIFEWPSLNIILDEPRAHKSFQDMDFSLDSEFLATTSSDGSGRIWKADDGVPVTSLTRNSDEKIELCRFSKDGTKPFLFCTVQKGNKALTAVWDISTWERIGHKRLLRKPASKMSVSLDGKYLALGSKDGDVCVVEVKKMVISHWSKKLHLGSCIASLEFCPSERVVLTTSKEWGAMVTKLTVPADWKDWQIYLLLLGLFLASAVAFYIVFEKSDLFWNFPIGRDQPARPNLESLMGDPQSDDQNIWGAFGVGISSALPIQTFKSYASKPPCSVSTVAVSGSASSSKMSNANANVKEEISETYSNTMTEAMGAVLTYRHELGLNYNFIRPDLIVGSCLQTPEDVDKLRSVGVKTIFCLQQDSDLEYFGVDITAIRAYASTHDDIEHLRAEIRDFDSFDLRMRLPAVVSKLHKAINQNGGVTYIHCTAGLGRAPATALAYMFWIQGYKLSEANNLLLSKRSCFPKLDAIKSATADILTGLIKKLVTLTWECSTCSNVEVSGLDIGWGQRIPMKFDKERGLWILQKELPEGRYEYKYVVDGEWTCNYYELVTPANKDGHVNNYVQVTDDDPNSITAALRARLTSNDPNLTTSERLQIRQFLEAYQLEG
ncbi:hypothetical protein RHGRI_007435 [Rhododendron griersonianum]|uniref:Dual specificity protein phosphatase 4 n=1 Tax=Rhododendron griersonianum TaxID=479676 RepID=A0AAV6KWZ1_9ERIC|nr:hypothetical protein RHGRI_007435 [Rhododendron griersonianum]